VDLRRTFDEDAALYDRVRPRYPDAMFDDLAHLAGMGRGCRVLEIGAGTGIATHPLAARGCRITAIELGANMAAVAAHNLSEFPLVRVVVDAFETWPLPAEPFDVVVSATAWHWLDPAVRVDKAAAALRTAGTLAVIETHHIAGGTEAFFVDAQDCYERWDPATPPGLRLEAADEIPSDDADLASGGRFGPSTVREYEWDVSYSSKKYLDVLMSYSGHRAMEADARRGLLACIGDLIEGRYAGRITKRYLTRLRTAKRL
jgi:SAM-dependent methyltransferase